jgi:phage-related protein
MTIAIPTFDPPFAPSPGAQNKPEIKILQAEFGDGYSQPTPAGLNHIRRVLTLQWEMLERCERDAMLSFFERRGGTLPFFFAMPGEAHIAYTCADWSDTALEAELYTVKATFKRYFGALA